MELLNTSKLKLGIIAGGQLGKMLIQEASIWDISTFVMDEDESCPARSLATGFVRGNRLDYNDVYQFGKLVDVLTYEIESINVDALNKLKQEGLCILPDPKVLEVIQDKGMQKAFFCKHSIPTAPYRTYNSPDEITFQIASGELCFPFVQKLCKGGYDGRGVAVIEDSNSLRDLLPGASIVEDKINISKEIAVIVARNKAGEVMAYPVVEMAFCPTANLVEMLICPASISAAQSDLAIGYARELISKLEMEGLLAVEFFVDAKGNVIVNEMAPRPHNSGHHTIESIITSQYEQHLRAILNLPLGSTRMLFPSVMLNILGEAGYEGEVLYEGLSEALAIEGVKIHLYGKKITKPYRKMGHVTILASTPEEALAKARQVSKYLKVRSWKQS